MVSSRFCLFVSMRSVTPSRFRRRSSPDGSPQDPKAPGFAPQTPESVSILINYIHLILILGLFIVKPVFGGGSRPLRKIMEEITIQISIYCGVRRPGADGGSRLSPPPRPAGYRNSFLFFSALLYIFPACVIFYNGMRLFRPTHIRRGPTVPDVKKRKGNTHETDCFYVRKTRRQL